MCVSVGDCVSVCTYTLCVYKGQGLLCKLFLTMGHDQKVRKSQETSIVKFFSQVGYRKKQSNGTAVGKGMCC